MATKKSSKAIMYHSRVKKYHAIAEQVASLANIAKEEVIFIGYAAMNIHGINIPADSSTSTVVIPQSAFDKLSRRYPVIVQGDIYCTPQMAIGEITITSPVNDNKIVEVQGLSVWTAAGLYFDTLIASRVVLNDKREPSFIVDLHLLEDAMESE